VPIFIIWCVIFALWFCPPKLALGGIKGFGWKEAKKKKGGRSFFGRALKPRIDFGSKVTVIEGVITFAGFFCPWLQAI